MRKASTRTSPRAPSSLEEQGMFNYLEFAFIRRGAWELLERSINDLCFDVAYQRVQLATLDHYPWPMTLLPPNYGLKDCYFLTFIDLL